MDGELPSGGGGEVGCPRSRSTTTAAATVSTRWAASAVLSLSLPSSIRRVGILPQGFWNRADRFDTPPGTDPAEVDAYALTSTLGELFESAMPSAMRRQPIPARRTPRPAAETSDFAHLAV